VGLLLLHTYAYAVGMTYIDGELFMMDCTLAHDPVISDLSLGCEVLCLSLTIVTL
jgi:hypothetical protein